MTFCRQMVTLYSSVRKMKKTKILSNILTSMSWNGGIQISFWSCYLTMHVKYKCQFVRVIWNWQAFHACCYKSMLCEKQQMSSENFSSGIPCVIMFFFINKALLTIWNSENILDIWMTEMKKVRWFRCFREFVLQH